MGKKNFTASLLLGALAGALLWGISKNLGVSFPYVWLAPFLFPFLAAFGTFLAFTLGKRLPVLFQAAKFLEVGALNTLVDLGILNLLIFTSGIATGLPFTLFKGVSFAGAVFNSYLWNKHWTFGGAEKKETAREFAQFLGVSAGGFLLNVGTASVVVNFVGPQFGLSDALWANVGALTATAVAMTWNFLGYKLLVFKT